MQRANVSTSKNKSQITAHQPTKSFIKIRITIQRTFISTEEPPSTPRIPILQPYLLSPYIHHKLTHIFPTMILKNCNIRQRQSASIVRTEHQTRQRRQILLMHIHTFFWHRTSLSLHLHHMKRVYVARIHLIAA